MNNEVWDSVIYFDSESTLLQGEQEIKHKPRLICAEFWRGEHCDQEDFEGDDCAKAFWGRVDAFCRDKTTVRLFAHNIGYDLQATGGIPNLLALGWSVDSLYEKGLTYILRLSKGHRRIVCLSSTQFWTAPLRDVAKHFGLEKLEVHHQTEDKEELKKYCRMDVEILRTAMNWLQKFIKDNDYGAMKVTLPSLAMGIFRHRFMPHDIYIHNYPSALALERASYHGGRCEAWFIGKVPEILYKLDVNSMYPYIMRDSLFPTKLIRYYPNGSMELLQEQIRSHIVIAEVEIETKENRYPYAGETKLLFPVGRFRTVLCADELQDALKRGHIRQVYQLAVYASAPVFREFITHFYNRRKEAKELGQSAAAELFKLLMNSLYGKFGQQSNEWTMVGEAPNDEVRSETILLPDGSTRQMRAFGGKVWVNDGAVMESFESFPAIAATVTANARSYLRSLIDLAGPQNCYYMDTDSIFVNESGYKRLAGKLSESELGALKLEGTEDNVVIRGAKDYTWGTKRKQKGIPKDAVFVVGEDGIERAKVWMWPKVATWLKEGTLGHFENRLILKKVNTTYDKGQVTTGGKVLPRELRPGYDEKGTPLETVGDTK